MKFVIDSGVLEKFPGLNIGILVAKGIDNSGSSEEVLNMLRNAERDIRSRFDAETLPRNPRIDAWRKAYSSFGAKPKKYRCSVENLYRMILQGAELRHINKLVDIYNYVSIKHTIPVGGDDTDRVEGNITLRQARGDEPFTELNSEEVKNPREGEIVYSDDREVLCRRWNWRECEKSKMTENTGNAALVVEGLPPVTGEDIRLILEELSALVMKFCGGETKPLLLNKSSPEAEI